MGRIRPARTLRAAGPLAAALAALLAGCPARPGAGEPARITADQAERAAERFDVGRFVTNRFIPRPGEPPPAPLRPRVRLRVALQWLISGDAAPWLVAEREGFFSSLGLDVELIPGGPGRQMLGGVVAGRYDVYVGYPDVVLALVASPTGADLRMIGATMKDSGVGWIGLDRSIPRTERSRRKITAADLRGKRIGVQPEAEFLLDYLCDRIGLPRSQITVLNEGATPDALVAGALDFYEGLRSDQPRLLERAGYENWTFLPMSEFGYSTYLDVSAVTADFCRRRPRVLACYLAALDRSIQYIAAHREQAARITAAGIPGYDGTVAEMRTRLDREIPLCLGDGSEPPLVITPARLTRLLAILDRYHRIDLAASGRQ
jgi:ABC-type nitrate/sulfonate/bicarbonate transport system substrate-binding protein